MINYIKAELYRITRGKTAINWVVYIFIDLLLIITTLINNLRAPKYQTVAASFPIMSAIIAMVPGAMIAKHYGNRTAYYEIMIGTNIHKLICYRLIVYIPILTAVYFIPVSVAVLLFDHSISTFIAIGLLYLIFLKMLFLVIGITMMLKTQEGAIVPYFIMMIESMLAVLALNSNNDGLRIAMTDGIASVFGWFSAAECTLISNGISPEAVSIKIIISFIAEAALMYGFAYLSYKRKWNIRTTIGARV